MDLIERRQIIDVPTHVIANQSIIDSTTVHVKDSPWLLLPFMHVASDQKLEPGKAWEQG